MYKLHLIDADLERFLVLKEMLPDDYSIEVSFNGWEGLGAALMYNPDILLVNIISPIMDGIEVIRLIRTEEKLAKLPILCYSHPKQTDAEELAKQYGCNHILNFPFDFDNLQICLNQCLKPSLSSAA